MSTGISIYSEPESQIDGYYQNFAMEFEDINYLLKKQQCDLSPFLYCPESFMEEEMLKEFGASDEEVAYTKLITTDAFHPVALVLNEIEKAIELVKSYDDEMFEHGKEGLVSDLEELSASLKPHRDSGIKIQLLRG
ncbi:hypothetical protein AAFN60_21310 [Roseibacillus persicicus]|uniref:hypothetical protein n=1 Tax=Roseibacillus persicicus TaxID=454148 RepID=UPI00398AA761